MYQKTEILAIITARGGSKGVPKKNIRLLNGKPLISYTVEAAKQSQYIDRVIISTDSEEIADTAAAGGAEKLFLRPAQFATDESPSWETIIHALQWIENHEKKIYPVFCLLQPTSPLRRSNHVDAAIEKYFATPHAENLVSVCESSKSPYWSQMVTKEGLLKPVIDSKNLFTRRQETPQTYDINGAIYIAKTESYLRTKSFLDDKTTFYAMSKEDSLDIDTELDFTIAEVISQKNR